MLSLMSVSYVSAQNNRTGSAGHIETPRERKARKAREAEARKKKQQQEAAARRQREAEERERMRPFRDLEANMVYVEGGTFMMGATSEQGSDVYRDEKPVHQVTLSSFHICKYEVTQELWQAVMGSNPSRFNGSKRPVEKVSWEDCQQFITKLNQLTGKNYRLPTEAEWEYAARGGNLSKGYKYAGSNSIGDVAWYLRNSDMQTHDVGMKRANELGLYDMAGNVDGWVQDWYDVYSSSSQTNPEGSSSGSYRVNRGGNWNSTDRLCRVSKRGSNSPGSRWVYLLGLRLAQ